MFVVWVNDISFASLEVMGLFKIHYGELHQNQRYLEVFIT